MDDLASNLFLGAAQMAKLQAEGYKAVREQARREALEEAAKLVESQGDGDAYGEWDAACITLAAAIRAIKVPA